MTDKPILFSAPMVRALLAGTKTQTRRAMKPQPELLGTGRYHLFNRSGGLVGVAEEDVGRDAVDYLRIAVGDRLWVREAWRCNGWATDVATVMYRASEGDGYTAMTEQYPVDGKRPLRVTGSWRPSIHMPRWASRLTLTVTDVRVERLQDISEADALAEGVERIHYPEYGEWGWPQRKYHELWNRINGDGAWESNPWVAAYTFTVQHGNIDQIVQAAA